MRNLEYDKCPLCQSEQISHYLKVKDHSISKEVFDLEHCRSCDFIFTQNPPVEEEIAPYYSSEDYISHSDTNKGLVNRLYHFVRQFMLGRKLKMVKRHSKGKDLLDVGSGTGYFLQHMKSNGYRTTGIEVSEDAKKIATERFGLDIRMPGELLGRQLPRQYDVITMWHVLEHLYGLHDYAESLRAALKDDGLLVIAVPNSASYEAKHYGEKWAAYDVPRHLWHFSPGTMKELANRHRLKIVDRRRLPFDAFYNAMLSEKYKENPLYLPAGFFYGGISCFQSLLNIEKTSSIVYFLKKAEQ